MFLLFFDTVFFTRLFYCINNHGDDVDVRNDYEENIKHSGGLHIFIDQQTRCRKIGDDQQEHGDHKRDQQDLLELFIRPNGDLFYRHNETQPVVGDGGHEHKVEEVCGKHSKRIHRKNTRIHTGPDGIRYKIQQERDQSIVIHQHPFLPVNAHPVMQEHDPEDNGTDNIKRCIINKIFRHSLYHHI